MTDVLHPLGGGHPDAVLFSTYIMDKRGGVEAVRRDFGGFLMEWSAFLDEHLEQARAIEFDDLPDHQYRRTKVNRIKRVDLDNPAIRALVLDPALTSRQVATRLGVAASYVRTVRQRHDYTYVGTNGPNCHACGNPLPAGASPNRRYCSNLCALRNRRGTPPPATHCRSCGTVLVQKPKGGSKRFCNSTCSSRYHRALDKRAKMDGA
jgi:hypothetical protein